MYMHRDVLSSHSGLYHTCGILMNITAVIMAKSLPSGNVHVKIPNIIGKYDGHLGKLNSAW